MQISLCLWAAEAMLLFSQWNLNLAHVTGIQGVVSSPFFFFSPLYFRGENLLAFFVGGISLIKLMKGLKK